MFDKYKLCRHHRRVGSLSANAANMASMLCIVLALSANIVPFANVLVSATVPGNWPAPTCRGACTTATTSTVIPYIGQETAWIGNGPIKIRLGYSQGNFVVAIKIPAITGWVESLWYPTVDRPGTYNVTVALQYNGILEPYNMHSLPDELVPDSADILGNILSQLIADGEVLPIGSMLTAYFNNHRINLLDAYEQSTLTFVSQDIGGQGQQTYGTPYFGNIRALTANTPIFNKCHIKLPPAPGAYNGWAPPSTSATNFSPSSTFGCAAFIDAYIALAKCNVSVPFQNGEGWTPFFLASCAQEYYLNLVNADGTSAIDSPKFIEFLDTIIRPMLLASKTGTEYMVNASSPSIAAYLATPEEEWDWLAGFPLGMLTTLIPSTIPQGMAYLTAAKPPAVGQYYTPGPTAPNYIWTLTVSSRSPPLQQYLALDWLRYSSIIIQPSTNVSAPVTLTQLGQTVYLAQSRLPYVISGRTAPQFTNLINTSPSLQIQQDLFTKGKSVSYPLSPPVWEAKSFALGFYNGLFACMGLKNLSTGYCANKTASLVNYNNLRACSAFNAGDVVYINIPDPGQDVCSGIYVTSYARWNISRVNVTCTIQSKSSMAGITQQYTTYYPPRNLLDGDPLVLGDETFDIVFSAVAIFCHIFAFLSAMASIDFYVYSLDAYYKNEIAKIDYRSLFAASTFLGTGIFLQTQLDYVPIELPANVCGVTGQASVRFWAGMQVVQLLVNIILAFVSMVVAQYALRLLITAKRDAAALQPLEIHIQSSDKKSDNAFIQVSAPQNISGFDENQSDQRRDKIKDFMAHLVDTRLSWFVFLISGSIQSGNMILGYWIGFQSVALSSDFAWTFDTYLLVIEWIGGSFFLGLVNYAAFRLYGATIIRYAIASVLPCCIVFIQWINLVSTRFEFASTVSSSLPSSTWSSTDAGFLVGALCFATLSFFFRNNQHVTISESRHALVVLKEKALKMLHDQSARMTDLATRTISAYRDEVANNAYESDVKKADLTKISRPYRLSILYWSRNAVQSLPIKIIGKHEVVHRAAPTQEMLKTPMSKIMSAKELFNRYAKNHPADTAFKMLDHPIIGDRFRQFLAKQFATENYLFWEDVNDYRELHKRGLEPIPAFWLAKAMYLTWFKSIDNVKFADIDEYILRPDETETDTDGNGNGNGSSKSSSIYELKDEDYGSGSSGNGNGKDKAKGKKTDSFSGQGSSRVNVSGAQINRIYARLCLKEAPANLFDETYAEISQVVLDPLRPNVMAMDNFALGNHDLFLPCTPNTNQQYHRHQQTLPSSALFVTTDQQHNHQNPSTSSPIHESKGRTDSISSPNLNGVVKIDVVQRRSPQMSEMSSRQLSLVDSGNSPLHAPLTTATVAAIPTAATAATTLLPGSVANSLVE